MIVNTLKLHFDGRDTPSTIYEGGSSIASTYHEALFPIILLSLQRTREREIFFVSIFYKIPCDE